MPEAQPPEPAWLGRVIDERYRVDRVLGEGGMGVVVCARDLRLKRDVALKLLHPRAVGDERARARMVREAHALAGFVHANVVHVYDAGETAEGGAYLAMELVEGQTVRRLMETRWPPGDRLQALIDVARALAAVHRAGLVHRDVKPENLMVRTDGRVVLLDFGLVRPAHAEHGEAHAITGPGAILGTLAYMSPEQTGSEDIDGRSDQFSFGVTAFEVLTGEHPWEGAWPAARFRAMLTAPAPKLSTRAALPEALDAVLERALAKDPAQRYPTMDELAEALGAASAGVSGVRFSRAPASISSAPTLEAFSGPPLEARPTMDALETADVPPPLPPAPPRRLRGLFARGGAVLAALGMAAAAWLGTRPQPVPLETEEALAAGTQSAEARAAFRSGLVFWRDGNNERAQAEWERATALDPGYGAAHLWLAADLAQEDLLKGRRAFEGATAARHGLQGGNQALYAALVPCIQDEPPDRATCMQKLEEAAAANPQVTYLRAWLTWIRLDTVGPTPETLAEMEQALTLPPGFGRLLAGKGLTLAYLGRFDEAMAVFERCPSGTACMEYQRAVHIQRAECSALATLGKRWVARDAQSMSAYQALAAAAQAGGQPEEAVHELVVQADLRAPRDVRPLQALLHRSAEAVLRGDFAEVRRVIEDAAPVVAPRPDRLAHVLVGQVAIELARETGDTEGARRHADGLLRRLGSWLSDARTDDVSISREFEPYLLDVLVETGGMPAAERAERLRRWEDEWRARAMPAYHPYLWLQGRGGLVRDEASAREALAKLPAGGVPPLYALYYRPDEGLGRMFLLTGDPRRALPYLRRAAEGCSALEDAWSSVRSAIPLGEALAATGDKEGACRAYQRVVSRWGKATPRSVSAEKARALSAQLGCEGGAP